MYKLTRGTCSIACRLELHAVAGLLWNSLCISDGAEFAVFFFRFFFFERTRPAASMRPPLSSLPFLLVMRQDRESEVTEAVICLSAKWPLLTGVRTGFHYLVFLLVWLCECV